MLKIVDNCRGCGKKTFIVNKKYYLGECCNKKRLGSDTKVKKSLSQVSKKERINLQRKNQAYQEIEEERVFNYVCGGCGQATNLSRSHLISQSNKDFQSNKENIFLDCIYRQNADKFGNKGCHERTESNNWELFSTLLDCEKKLAFLKKFNLSRYNKLMINKEEYESRT